MRKYFAIAAAALLLAGCGMPLLQAPAIGPAQEAGMNVVPVSMSTADAELKANASVNYGYVIVKVAADFDEARLNSLGAARAGAMTVNGQRYYRLRKDAGYSKLINDLRVMKGVLYAEPELVSKRILPETKESILSRSLGEGNLALDPDGNLSEYALAITQALDSYKTVAEGGNGYGANTVYVGVLDTGINMAHKDFWYDHDADPATADVSIVEYAKSAWTFDGNAFAYPGDDIPFVSIPVGQNWDDEAHGTHVSGTIAARGDNGVGVAGVAWKNVKLISYKVFCNNAVKTSDWAIYGSLGDLASWVEAKRVADPSFQKTVPVNMSLGGDFAGSFEYEMINYALSQGVLPVVATGNDGMYIGQFPASYQGVLAVGATNGMDEKVHFSNSGHWISVSAPGYDIISTGNGGLDWNVDDEYRQTEVQWMSGTSMATPFVTGTIGYLLSFNDQLTPYQIKAVLEQTADDVNSASKPGWDEDLGYGRVNVLKAATMVRTGTGLPAAGSAYVETKIVATVENRSVNYDSGLGVGLDKRVVGQEVSLYDNTGRFLALALTNGTNGEVEFRGLPPGSYTLKTNFFGDMASQAVTLDNTVDQSVAFSFNKNIVYISTVKAMAYNGGADTTDTAIDVYEYDPAGTDDDTKYLFVKHYDKATLDTLMIELESGKTYFAMITAYDADSAGNYGIQIGFSPISSTSTTDGARSAADNDSHEDDGTFAEAIAKGEFALETPFAANLATADDVDIFMFTIP